MATDKKLITLKTLNKSNVWELQENDVFRIWSAGEKDADMTENINRYIPNIARNIMPASAVPKNQNTLAPASNK